MYTTDNMPFDDSYYNKTINRYARKGKNDKGIPYEYPLPIGVVLHETASPNPDNAKGTLNYNLTDPPGSSYDFLIARDEKDGYATIFRYVNPKTHISYHAGVNSSALGFTGWNVNVNLLGIEVDGRNNGEPATSAQIRSLKLLAQWLYKEIGIIISSDVYLAHSFVAPRDKRNNIYKSDPRGYNSRVIDEAGLLFMHKPRITFRVFQEALAKKQSPILPEAEAIYNAFINAGIDPAIGLAFAYHEHKFGLFGIINELDLRNWGAVRTHHAYKGEIVSTSKGTFAKYPSWLTSVHDWIARIKGRYISAGLYTVERAIPVYAPTSDGNNPKAYINAVYKLLASWNTQADFGHIPLSKEAMYEVPNSIATYWSNSGREWLPDRYTLGYIKSSEKVGETAIYFFERGRLRLNADGSIDSMLLNE